MSLTPFANSSIGVGFGTAALGGQCYQAVTEALKAGFRRFDTAEENEYWYDPENVGAALKDFFAVDADCLAKGSASNPDCGMTCQAADLRVSTKIPPWHLTTGQQVRANAKASRDLLVGFCEDEVTLDTDGQVVTRPYPLDVYYIHAPACWQGWHPQCDHAGDLMNLREAWLAMETVVDVDYSARRIGLSNVHPQQLLDIIAFVDARKAAGQDWPAPRYPDVVQAFADPIEPDEDLRSVCEEHGIEFVSYSTLGTQHRSVPHNPVLGSPTVKELAAKYQRSTAEVVLSWAMQRGMSVIPRSNKKVHIQELARLLNHPMFLSPDDLAKIDAMKHTV